MKKFKRMMVAMVAVTSLLATTGMGANADNHNFSTNMQVPQYSGNAENRLLFNGCDSISSSKCTIETWGSYDPTIGYCFKYEAYIIPIGYIPTQNVGTTSGSIITYRCSAAGHTSGQFFTKN